MIKTIFISTVSFFSCNSYNPNDHLPIQVIITIGQSYKYDLKNQIYTVMNISKPSINVKFKLSDHEREKITDKYYALELNNIKTKTFIKDDCREMPKLITTLEVERQNSSHQIFIDIYCNRYSQFDSTKAIRVKDFINYVFDIIKSKSEIKNIPKSDMIYM